MNTNKRAVISFLIMAMISAGLLAKIASVSVSEYSDASVSKGARVLNISQSRGMIYDRNMTPLVNTEMHTALVINPTFEAREYLKNALSENEYKTLEPSLQGGRPFVTVCDSYTGECGDIISLITYDRYSENDTAQHIIGYLDSEGKGVSGIEKSFDNFLTENSGSLSVRYYASSGGSALSGKGFEIVDNNYDSEAGIVLTVDSDIQRICENAMERGGIDKGAVVVLDVSTSEIIAAASSPVFDRFNMSSALDNEDLPFINRTLEAYSVGSVFKPIVAAAALEKGIDVNTVFNCEGYVNVNGQRFNCHNKSGHGELDMAGAMAQSCNSYFIQLGAETGEHAIISMASRLGIGKKITLGGSLSSSAGVLPSADEIDSKPALANLSFGQGTLLASPLQIAAVYCAFANGGYYREPYILKSMTDKNGNITAYYKNEINEKVLSDSVNNEIRSLLEETVLTGSGKLAKPMCCDAAGKTATAETGMTKNGSSIVHTWFAGYFPSDSPEYVVVVFKEDGDTSSTDCAPVFRDVADGIEALKATPHN